VTDIDKLRALAEAATPGPWSHEAVRFMQHDVHTPDSVEADGMSTITCWHRCDAAFIAAFNPTAVLALLDELAALRKVAEAACGLFDAAEKCSDRPWMGCPMDHSSVTSWLYDAIDAYRAWKAGRK
jgi:hypothetical protein